MTTTSLEAARRQRVKDGYGIWSEPVILSLEYLRSAPFIKPHMTLEQAIEAAGKDKFGEDFIEVVLDPWRRLVEDNGMLRRRFLIWKKIENA